MGTKYPGTPTNPIPYQTIRKIRQNQEVIKPHVPYVPGFTPVDPNGNPLKPVDPNDPTKGYEVPNIPSDPTRHQSTTFQYRNQKLQQPSSTSSTFYTQHGWPT